MPKIDVEAMEWKSGSGYPTPFQAVVEGRMRKRLGNEVGLDQFGVNVTKLAPNAQSAVRHWHENEDELIFVLQGELTLIEDEGEIVLRSGDAAGWKAGAANGHHLINRTQQEAVYLEIGSRAKEERAHYPDDDLLFDSRNGFTRKDCTPYEEN